MKRLSKKELANLREIVSQGATHTAKVRNAAKYLKTFCIPDIEYLAPCLAYRQISAILFDMMKTGEVKKTDPGQYEYAGKERQRTKMDVIWHLIRSHRQFDTDEIERLSGAARYTVLEYLNCLKNLGYLRQKGNRFNVWTLVNDPGPDTPVNTGKCSKLRKLRSKKKMSREQGTERRNQHGKTE
ncbi:MAG: hypothetical protein FP816_09050 [Desulfobacteraceae bacterium]|nr:hypothetical protein [Desulfobacteraceae bacterium]